jgi:hypothetical protein
MGPPMQGRAVGPSMQGGSCRQEDRHKNVAALWPGLVAALLSPKRDLKHSFLVIFEVSEGLGGSGGPPGASPGLPGAGPQLYFFEEKGWGTTRGPFRCSYVAALWQS